MVNSDREKFISYLIINCLREEMLVRIIIKHHCTASTMPMARSFKDSFFLYFHLLKNICAFFFWYINFFFLRSSCEIFQFCRLHYELRYN